MNRESWCSASVLVVAVLWPVAASAQAPASAELPKLVVGSVWKYREIDLWNNAVLSAYEQELVAVEAERLVFRSRTSPDGQPDTRYYSRSLASCRRMRDSDVDMCDGSLAFPLRVGDRKTYEKRPWLSGVGANSAECEVKGIESVSVPAGTFDAFRVQCDGTWTRVFDLRADASSKSGRFEDTIWYAPVVGREVKWTYVDYFGPGRVYNKKQTELTEFLPK